jgi:putative membrane protein
MMSGWGMGFGTLGFLFMAVFWIVIIAAAVWLLGYLFPRKDTTQPSGSANETAVDILEKRYARGELSREEFKGMRQDLERQ